MEDRPANAFERIAVGLARLLQSFNVSIANSPESVLFPRIWRSVLTESASRMSSCCSCQLAFRLRRPCLVLISNCSCGIGVGRLASCERLFKVVNDVVDVFRPHGNANQVLGNAAVYFLLITQLFVSCTPGMNGEGLAIADAASS